MSEKSRKDFLKSLSLLMGTTVLATNTILANPKSPEQIRKLSAEQQEFMAKYENWMDEFIKLIRIQRNEPGDTENNLKIVQLSNTVNGWQPVLSEYMKEETFASYFTTAIQRMTVEI